MCDCMRTWDELDTAEKTAITEVIWTAIDREMRTQAVVEYIVNVLHGKECDVEGTDDPPV